MLQSGESRKGVQQIQSNSDTVHEPFIDFLIIYCMSPGYVIVCPPCTMPWWCYCTISWPCDLCYTHAGGAGMRLLTRVDGVQQGKETFQGSISSHPSIIYYFYYSVEHCLSIQRWQQKYCCSIYGNILQLTCTRSLVQLLQSISEVMYLFFYVYSPWCRLLQDHHHYQCNNC